MLPGAPSLRPRCVWGEFGVCGAWGWGWLWGLLRFPRSSTLHAPCPSVGSASRGLPPCLTPLGAWWAPPRSCRCPHCCRPRSLFPHARCLQRGAGAVRGRAAALRVQLLGSVGDLPVVFQPERFPECISAFNPSRR